MTLTYREYLQKAVEELKVAKNFLEVHYKECKEICATCVFYNLIPANISVLEAAIASPEEGVCDDESCINNLGYNIANSIFILFEERENLLSE
jgi:hypothetical protein